MHQDFTFCNAEEDFRMLTATDFHVVISTSADVPRKRSPRGRSLETSDGELYLPPFPHCAPSSPKLPRAIAPDHRSCVTSPEAASRMAREATCNIEMMLILHTYNLLR